MRQFHKNDVVRYVPTSFMAMDRWAGRKVWNAPLVYSEVGVPTPGAIGVVKFEPYGAGNISVEMPFYGLYSIAACDLEWVGVADADTATDG